MDTSTTTCSMQGKEYANIIKIRISTKLIPMNTLVTVDRPASMTEQEWRKAIKFDSTDWGWIIMSIGMAIGAGIVFLPVKVGLVGLWVFLVSSVIAYPAMYLFQRLFINTLAESPECKDYPSVISGYLGKNWGFFIGILYFIMLVIWVFIYSTALTNDSASFLHSFGVTKLCGRTIRSMVWLSSASWWRSPHERKRSFSESRR